MYKIKEGRNLYLAGIIGWEDLMEISLNMTTIMYQDSKIWINLFITSYGGEIGAGLALYDFITKIAKPKLQTVVVREADSMSIAIVMAGTHRVITQQATMFFHDVGAEVYQNGGRMPRREIKKIAESLEERRCIYAKIISERSGLTVKEVLHLIDKEENVDARRALKFGLVDEIIK